MLGPEQGSQPPQEYDYIKRFPPGYFSIYESPFSYRYGSMEMRRLWSEESRWLKRRQIWLAVAETQLEAGLVSPEQVADLRAHINDIDINTILRREMDRDDPRYTGHDINAAISEYADKAPIGGEILHQGLTSEDLLSNEEILTIREAFQIIEGRLLSILPAFGEKVGEHKDKVCMGWTHFQAAEPTTVGYRLARTVQDLLVDLRILRAITTEVKGKGIKGAVGTSASFTKLLEGTRMTPWQHEEKIMEKLDLDYVTVSGQTYPRKFYFLTIVGLGSIAQTVHEFALNGQILQSSLFGEVFEPQARGQQSSSAMPGKRNPRWQEQIDSLGEDLPGKITSAWITSAFVTFERSLRDSASKRSVLPEAFLALDEILSRTERVIKGLEVSNEAIKGNLDRFSPFAALELILLAATRRGANRQEIYQILVDHGKTALAAVNSGLDNPLEGLVASDPMISSFLSSEEAEELFREVKTHIGAAPQSCDKLLAEMQAELEKR